MQIELLISLVVGIGLGWLLRQWQASKVLSWWEYNRFNQLHYQAEQLRNAPLQDLFGLRRNLELFLITHNLREIEAGQKLLSQLKTAIEQLEQSSDRLSSPFDLSKDGASLPLALRHILLQGELLDAPDRSELQPEPASSIKVNLDLPQQWSQPASVGGLLLLSLVEQLTQHYREAVKDTELVQPISLDAQLVQQPNQAEFTLCLHLLPDTAAFSPADAEKLCQAFRLLSGGQCQLERSDESEAWRFAWS